MLIDAVQPFRLFGEEPEAGGGEKSRPPVLRRIVREVRMSFGGTRSGPTDMSGKPGGGDVCQPGIGLRGGNERPTERSVR